MNKYIYVAGPYSVNDPVLNVRRVIAAAEFLRELGFVPFIPHLTHLWHLVSPHEYSYWIKYDNEWLKKCDSFIRIPGYSKGADAEMELARKLGLTIYEIEDGILKVTT